MPCVVTGFIATEDQPAPTWLPMPMCSVESEAFLDEDLPQHVEPASRTFRPGLLD